MGTTKARRLAVIGVLLAALAIRVVASFWWQAQIAPPAKFAFPDSVSYWVLAQKVAEGEPYQFGNEHSRVFRTPGYPVLLAGLFVIFGGEPPMVAARVLGAVLGTMAVAAVMVLAHQLFNEGTALIAGVIACIYPGAIGMSVFVLSEAGFCPLMLLTLISWIAAWRTSPFKWQTTFGILTGVAAGVGTLIRPSWLLFVPFCLAFCVVLSPQRIRHFTVGGCVVAGIVISMLPWWIRNYLVTNGKFVPTTLQVGASLYDGLHPGATGASDTGMTFVGRFGREQQEADRASQQPLDGSFEYRLDRRMKEAAIAWAKDNPGRFVQLMGIKLARIWSVWPNAAEMKGWKMGVVVFVGYVPILVLAVVGAWKYLRLGWPYILCVMPAVYFSALHAVFVGSIRYRQPAMLALIVLAAAAIASWYRGAGFKDSETMQTCHE